MNLKIIVKIVIETNKKGKERPSEREKKTTRTRTTTTRTAHNN